MLCCCGLCGVWWFHEVLEFVDEISYRYGLLSNGCVIDLLSERARETLAKV